MAWERKLIGAAAMSVPGYVLPNDQPNIETSATHWTKPVEFNMKPQPEVYGIMHQARVHKLSSFFINTHGAKNVDVYITNESFGSNIPVKISPEQKINILKAEFTSHFIGVLKIEVVADEKQICTLLCEVFDPEQVKIETDQKVGTVGKTIQFGIKKADAGYAELLAVISDPAGHLLPREIYEVEGHQNVVTFKPNIEGTYKINISYGGEEILGSPFEYAIQNECETVHFASHDVRLKNIENQNDISRSSNIKPNIVKVVNKSVPNGKKYSNNQIYVRGLSSDIAEEEISEMFRAAGDIKISKKNGKEMILIYKDINGKKKGEATVTFYHAKAALLAVEKFNGMQYKRRTLEVSMSIINMTPGPQSCTNNDFSLPQNVENLTVVKEVNENSNEDVTSKEERWMMSDKTVPPIDLKLEQEVLWKCNQVNCKIDGFTSLEQLKSHLKFHYLSPSDVHAIDSEPKQISRMIFKDSSNDVIKGRGPFTFASTNEYLTKEYECLEDLCRMTFDTEQHLLNHIYQFHRSEPHTKQSSNSNDKFSTLDALNRGKKSLKWHSALEQHKQIWWRCNQPNCNFFGCNNARKMQIHLAHHKLSSKEIIKFAEDETAMNTHLTKIVRTVYKDGSQKRIGCGSSSMTSNNKAIQEFTCEAEENCDFICKLEYEILDHWNRIHPCVVKDKQRTAKLVTEEGTKWKCMNMNCEQVIYCLPGSLKLAEHWIASHSAIDLSTLSFQEMSTNQVMNIEKIYGHISACGEMDCGFIATSHLSLNEVEQKLKLHWTEKHVGVFKMRILKMSKMSVKKDFILEIDEIYSYLQQFEKVPVKELFPYLNLLDQSAFETSLKFKGIRTVLELARENSLVCVNLRGLQSNKYSNLRSGMMRYMAEFIGLSSVPNLAMNQCYNCFAWSHTGSQCQQVFRCHNCYQQGHYSSECENPQVCYLCMEEGHAQKDCRWKNVKF